MEWDKLITLTLRQPFISAIVDSSRSVMSVLYTFSCSIRHMLAQVTAKQTERKRQN